MRSYLVEEEPATVLQSTAKKDGGSPITEEVKDSKDIVGSMFEERKGP